MVLLMILMLMLMLMLFMMEIVVCGCRGWVLHRQRVHILCGVSIKIVDVSFVVVLVERVLFVVLSDIE